MLELTPGAAQHARDRLLADGDLIDTPAGPAVTDPLLADWVRLTFPL